MYGLAANFVSSWDDFVNLFLIKYFPNAKTVKLRNEIDQFVQLEWKSFSKYLDMFKNLLAQCPIIVQAKRICTKLFMKDLTNTLELCQSPYVTVAFFVRASLLLGNFQKSQLRRLCSEKPLEMTVYVIGLLGAECILFLK